MNQAKTVSIVGALALAIGSLLDWATVNIGFGQIGVAGTEGDGMLTLGAGLLALVLILVSQPKPAAVVAAIGTAIALYDMANLASKFAGSGAASVGIGLYLCVAGGAAATIGGFMTKPVAPAALVGRWHPDPYGRHEQRFHDGSNWTAYVGDGEVQGVDPLT